MGMEIMNTKSFNNLRLNEEIQKEIRVSVPEFSFADGTP